MRLSQGEGRKQGKAFPAQRGHDAGRDVLAVHKLPRLEQRLGAPQKSASRIEREPDGQIKEVHLVVAAGEFENSGSLRMMIESPGVVL